MNLPALANASIATPKDQLSAGNANENDERGTASLVSAQTVDQLIPHKVKVESVDYVGKRAVKMTEDGQVATVRHTRS